MDMMKDSVKIGRPGLLMNTKGTGTEGICGCMCAFPYTTACYIRVLSNAQEGG